MSYCATTDIQSEFKNITIGSATRVTTSEVEEFILQADNVINSRLSTILTTPVGSAASPNMFSVCKRLSTMLVVNRLKSILEIKTGSEKTDTEKPENLETKALDEIDEIIIKRQILDGVRLSTGSYGISDYNNTNDITQTFDVTTDQW